jgi:hypothetical protein
MITGVGDAPQEPGTMLVNSLSATERRVWDAFPRGEQVDLRAGDPKADDPESAGSWSASRRVRGVVMAALLLGAADPVPGHTAALRLAGALVAGDVGLKQAVVQAPVELTGCRVMDVIRLTGASLSGVDLSDSVLSWFDAESATINGNVSFARCRCAGEIRLINTHITGTLALTGAKLSSPYGLPLTMDGAEITGVVACSDIDVTGETRLLGTHITGSLTLTGATLNNPEARSLSMDHAKVDGGVYCSGMKANGEVRLLGSRIQAELSINGALVDNPGGTAIEGFGLSVEGSMFCQDGFHTKGEFRLVGAHITGQLGLNGARLENPGKKALTADGLTVDGVTFCGGGFHATGEVRLPQARLSKQMTLSGGSHFENPGGIAVQAAGLGLDGDLVGENVRVEGEFRLAGSTISGQLDFRGAEVDNRGDTALDLDGSVIGQDLLFTKAHMIGEVRMLDARLGAQLQLNDAHLEHDGVALLADRVTIAAGLSGHRLHVAGNVRIAAARITGQLQLDDAQLGQQPDGTALQGEHLSVDDMLCQGSFRAIGEVRLTAAHITGQLGVQGAQLGSTTRLALNLQQITADSLWLERATITGGIIDLTSAKVISLHDEPSRWTSMCLDGFGYDDLQPYVTADGAQGRLEWLLRSPEGYRPQPYEQLASYYRKLGNDQEARTVLLAKQRQRRPEMPLATRLFGYVLDILVGYGYRPLRAFGWLVCLLAFGSWYFALYHPAPVDPVHHPHFQPILYAASLIIPVVNLGQNGSWNTAGGSQWIAAILIAMGWILATAVVAAITRVLTRD